MPKRKFALERGGKKVLQVRWRRGLREFEVAVEGAGAWRLEPAAVRAGATVTLPGGSTLLVQQVKRAFWSIAFRDELRLERDGVPVPGSDGDPPRIARSAGRLLLLLGLLRVMFLALYELFRRVEPGEGAIGSGAPALLGLCYVALLVLAILASFGRRLPVVLAAGVLGLELAVSLLASAPAAPVGVLVQVLVIVHLVNAWRRMRPRAAAPTLGAVFE